MKSAQTLSALIMLMSLSANTSLATAFSAVGKAIKDISHLKGKRLYPCAPTDCEILRPDGSRLTIFGKDITRQRYLRREAGSRLPFGLAKVKSKANAIKIVESHLGVRFSTDDGSYYQAPFPIDGEELSFIYIQFDRIGSMKEIGVSLGET